MRTQKNASMPQIISQITVRAGKTREQWGADIDRELLNLWKDRSSVEPSEADGLYDAIAGAGERDSIVAAILFAAMDVSNADFAVLDEIIIQQAVTLGWRLMTSKLVLFCLARCTEEPFRPELFECLGGALAKSVRILRDAALRMKDHSIKRPCELPPINDPSLRDHKNRAVPELRVLLREMRTEVSTGSLLLDGLPERFLKAIEDHERFPMLATNPVHWAVFLKDEENADALKSQMEKRLEPAALWRSWLAWFKGHDSEYVRKKLSSLPSSK